MRKITLLFAVLLSLAGVTKAADSVTEGFEYATDGTTTISVNDDNMGLSNGWIVVGSGNYVGIATGTSKDLQLKSGTYVHEGTYSIGTQYSNSNTWLVCPVEVSGTLKFYARRYNTNRVLTIGLASKDGDSYTITNSSLASYTTQLGTEYTEFSIELGDDPVYVAFKPSYAYFDNVTYTPYEQAEGPALAVKDGSTKLASPYAYNFGLATPGTTKTFTLSNPGTENLTVSVAETGNFNATLSATTIAAGGEVTLTLTAPEATGSSVVTISSDAADIEDLVINVGATIRDENKLFVNFADADQTSEWTKNNWTFSTTGGGNGSSGGGYAVQESSEYYNYRLVTEKITFTEGEQLLFLAARKAGYSGISSYTNLKVQYSADGSTWTDALSIASTDLTTSWQTFSATMPAGTYYVGFYGAYTYITDIYGGQLPSEPKFVVTQPASLAYGVITEATEKTFTIANPGRATLNNIKVTSSNDLFTVTGAPTSLDADGSAEVTVTMPAATVGVHSATITVSADGFDDVTFVVTGTVLPTGLSVIDFADGLPARWSNGGGYNGNGWQFNEGIASTSNYTCTLTSPKVVVAEGNMLVVKARINGNYSSYYVTVNGLDVDGETVYTKKLSNDVLNADDYTAVLLSEIPTTVTTFQFVGYYAYLDEIQGINYAADLAVTKAEEAVASGNTYDFGESAADATVTYTFDNAGAGSINITNVAVSGDGAAAYTTNWSKSVAVPFDLVITRSYDATREGAAVAVVTVKTTEGDFVINVTGTDKAANAPELAVSPDEDAAFGVVTEATSKTYTVTNAGTGTLTVAIASDNKLFTVSAAELADIAAGDSKTFDVTFTPAEESYDVFNASITITPSYDAEAAVTVPASAKVKDPALWSEDFAADELPTGWDAGSNWTIADGVAKAAYGDWNSSTTYLTTPTLTVNGTGDELTFDYKATAGNVNVKIFYSKDGGEFVSYSGYPSWLSAMSEFSTFTITGLEAGSYQFRFANDDYELDNFEGFKLNLPDHIATISAYTIPESSSWNVTMKEGKSFEATVTVKEMRGVEEELTAKFYMGDDVIGTATGTVAAKGTETLTITATPTVAAPDAKMHIEVAWAGDTLKTDTVTRYVAAITRLTLDETSDKAVVAGIYDYLTLKRTFAEGWNTVCLPFTVSDIEALLGTGAKAYEFSSYADGELGFSSVTELTASYPHIVYVPVGITEDIELTDITIASNDTEGWYKTSSEAKFQGTYAPIAAGGLEGKYGVTDEAKIAKGTAEASIKGFRAYFELPEGQEVKALIFRDGTTGVQVIRMSAAQAEGIFDLAGRKVNAAQKGIFIQNGKKFIVK